MRVQEALQGWLDIVMERVSRPVIERGLRRGNSLSDILASHKCPFEAILHMLHMQVKHTLPWAVLVHLEPTAKKEVLIMEPYELFQVCPPGVTKRKSPPPPPHTHRRQREGDVRRSSF